MLFVRAYPRETQETVFDAHDRAFALQGHLRARHLRQHEDAVETVFVGKDRLYNWVLPAAMERVRRKLVGADHGNRQMVDILTAVLTDGLPAVAPRRSRRASTPPTSSSTSWLASATPGRPQRSSRQPG
jgi:hypothetical protein